MSGLPTRTEISGAPSNATARAALTALYDMIAQRLAGGTSGAGTATDEELFLARETLQLAPAQMANLWMNSDFAINQRVATTAADGAYGFDRTYVLCESGSLTLSQLAQPTDGIPYAMRMTQPDVSAKRFGCAQAVEAQNCLAHRGGKVAFAPKVRSSGGGEIRVALLAHTGAANSITRDVVNTWSSTTYTPGNFFISSNLSVIAVGSVTASAGAWTDVPVTGVAPSSMNNLIMAVWTASQQAQNSTLDVSLVRAGLGSQVPIWTPPDAATELMRCMRYYQTSYDGLAPGTGGAAAGRLITFSSSSSSYAKFEHRFVVPMRDTPAISYYNPSSGSTSNQIRNETVGTDFVVGELGGSSLSRFGFYVQTTAAPPASHVMSLHFAATADL